MDAIRSEGIEAAASAKGAELQSVKDREGREYLWQGDPAFWARRSPLLFPIVGALPGGTYSHEGATYKLGNHGFAKELDFAIVERGASVLRYELASDEKSLALYPFRFRLGISYKVEGKSLEVGYAVRNEDSRRMHFSIGAHPAFRAPLDPGERREDFDLVFEKKERVRRHFLNSDNVRTGESETFLEGQDRIGLGPSLFEKGAIVLADHASRWVRLESRRSGRSVKVRFPGFPRLGIWSPRGDCPFVCIEPWYGIMPLAGSTQELAKKEGALSLEPGAVFEAAYTIELG
jgi:galactose mutarotase-like enzyme